MDQIIELKEKATHDQVKAAFQKLGWDVWETKPKQPGEKPQKKRKVKEKTAEKPATKEKKTAEKPKKAVEKEE